MARPEHERDVILCGAHEDPFRTTLEAFLAENDLDESEVNAIQADLARHGRYIGGGGASPVFLLIDPPETYMPEPLPLSVAA